MHARSLYTLCAAKADAANILCTTYIMGVTDTWMYLQSRDDMPAMPRTCIPGGLTMEALRFEFVAYVDLHQEALDYDADQVVAAMELEAHRCPVK